MKTLEFLYQSAQIHFLVNPGNDNVMINATEMAKVFGKRLDRFTRSEHAKSFINVLEKNANLTPNGVRIIQNRGRNGVYFHRILALKFAAWLDPEFELWVFSKIEEITFGNYKKHWDAHAAQEAAKVKMAELKQALITEPDKEKVVSYFEAENEYNQAKKDKTNAIRNQYKLFES